MTATNDVSSIAVFCVGGVIVGTVAEVILKYLKIPIPYTVFIFYIGLLVGALFETYQIPVSSYMEVSKVSSDLIVYGFLPVLLFSESMNLNR
jgi:NhaP-type Na+/H+ or K+/H+ antiporter